ncbi:MAG TPA: bifunctional ADP-heptose synthase [Nitrospinota bacterium]|jgi:rfaE bifunctional protein kinase chain/domain|nr:bifunctional ADP-heptose synthase [Nitrospinota bacterium]MDP7663364.1 bifunctional ADP-heptose synthase [Nitrospinota bacterium]HJP13581.1 bifunctional ADP-heptose synthase [Nitrospinota bacterium]
MSQSLREYVERFPSLRVAVVGDYIADEFIHGDTSRISREAPVIVLDFNSREILPGGGGNAAMNAASLGGKVAAIGALGADVNGEALRHAAEAGGVEAGNLILEKGRFTPTKMRIMAGGRNTSRQQVIRIDHERQLEVVGKLEARILSALDALPGDGVNALIVSDYGLGVVTDAVREAAGRLAREMIVTVDSRHRADTYEGITAITPNEEEVERLLGYVPEGDRLGDAGAALLERTGARAVLITRGSKGMSVFESGGTRKDIPVFGSEEASDVTGAGDTVISAFTLSLAAGAPPPDAAEIANRAAGLVVMKRGTATVYRDELLGTLEGDRS